MANRKEIYKNKYETRKNRNRKLAGILAVLLIVALLLGAVMPAFVRGEEPGTLEITGEVGFSRRYKLYGKTPVYLTVENNGADFKGELQIWINYSSEPNYPQNVIYAYPLDLPSGSIRDISLEVEIPVIRTKLTVSCVDQDGKMVLSKDLDTIAMEITNTLIGALTDDRNSLNYFRQMQLNIASSVPNKAVSDNLVFLDEATMPDNVQVLNNFNFIIINNYDTGRLTKKQIDVLAEWVATGGVLILGSGPNYQKVFKTLGSFIEADSAGQARVNRFNGEALDTAISIQQIEVKDGTSILTAGTETLVSELKIGNGKALIHAFDLGVAPIPNLSNETSFLEQLYLPYVMDAVNLKDISTNYYGLYGSNIQLIDRGRIIAIFVILGVYCLVIGPILYVLLKRADKRERAFIFVPVTALTAILVIGGISYGSPYRNPLTSSNSLINLDSGSSSGEIESTVRAFSPSKGQVQIDFDRDVSLISTNDMNYFYYSGGYGYTTNMSSTDSADKKISYGDNISLTFYKSRKWSGNQYKVKDKLDLDGSIICDFTIDGENLVGTVTNTTDLDFVDVIIGFANDYQKYDFLGANSTLEVVQPFPSNVYNYGRPQASLVYQTQNIQGNNLSMSERQAIRQREILLNYYINTRQELSYRYGSYYAPMAISARSYAMSTTVSYVASSSVVSIPYEVDNGLFDVSVFCFNYDNLNTFDVLINDQSPTNFNLNLFDIKTSITLNDGAFIKTPPGMLSAYVEGGDIDFDYADSSSVYITRGGQLRIRFDTPGNIEPSAFGILWDSMINPMPLAETALIYNNQTEEWEQLPFTKGDSELLAYYDSLESGYISSEGTIMITVDLPVNTYFKLPSFSIEGILKGSDSD